MEQNLALKIMQAGESVFLTGPAGSGKTYLLNQFINWAKKNGKNISITATTGLAATHLGGNTIHSWSGIGILDSLPDKFLSGLSKTKQKLIESTDILVVDEISMLHDYRLDMIEEICRSIRQNDQPFGGIQVVMSGDFFQLPPVNSAKGRAGGFVINSRAWQELDPVICYLSCQYRHDDESLANILDSMRQNRLEQVDVDSLLDRQDADLGDQVVTELHTTNVDVDAINQSKLDEIDEREHTFKQLSTGSKKYVSNLSRSILAPETLKLKLGVLVMAVKNSSDKRYMNGSIGVVVGFDKLTSYPIVEFKNGKTVIVMPDSWELKDGDKKLATVTQVPLRLAYAITVHKSQGMTIDMARIDLSKAFIEGMGYVALSRVRRLKDLSLVGINRMALQVSPLAINTDKQLLEQSKIDKEKFVNILENKNSVQSNKSSKSNNNGWQNRLAKIRSEYPNAYTKWSSDQDLLLRNNFNNGASIEELSTLLKRQPSSIIARLQKTCNYQGSK